ncbi:MAG: diguanylate cyclase [Planctomycetota bacterium]
MSELYTGGPSYCEIDPTRGERRSLRLLIVDDDPTTRQTLAVYAKRDGFDVEVAADGVAALAALRAKPAPIVLSDWHMPGMTGLELCAAIRQEAELGFVYFLMLTARDDEASLGRAFEAGADDFIVKPVGPIGLRARLTGARRICEMEHRLSMQNHLSRRHNTELERMTRRLEHAAMHDELTGLYNRQAMRNRVGELWGGVAGADYPKVTCAICDIDKFKSINDTRGHHVGDAAIRRAATAIRSSMPASAFTARLGGDEFVVLDTESSPRRLAEAMREASAWLADPAFKPDALIDFPIRLSVGVACTADDTRSEAELLRVADETLYDVKEAGRGHVRVRGDEGDGGDVAAAA